MKQMRKRLFAAVLSVAIACSWCVPAGAACAHRYTTVEIEAVEPTCDKDGAKAKIVCVECDKVLQKNSTIKKLGHNYKDKNGKAVWVANEEGHWQQCTVCGEPKEVIAHKYNIDDCEKYAVCTDKNCSYAKAPGEHVWKETVVEATCLKAGTLTRACTVCKVKEIEEIPIAEHNFGDKYGKNANGHWLVCSNKGCKAIDEDSREAHNYGDITCDEAAKCADCGTSRKKGQHNFVLDSVNEKEHVYVCNLKDCTATKTSEHDFGKAKCGDKNVACLVDGCDYVTEKVEHDWKESVKEATCSKTGTLTRICTVCKVKETEELPIAEHNFGDKYGKNANEHWLVCSNKGCKAIADGSYERHDYDDAPCDKTAKCVECGNSRKKGQHDFVLESVGEDGHEYVCSQSDCDERKTEYHTFDKAKCGDENVTCLDEECGYTVSEVGHKWGKEKVIKKVTCITDGEATYTCTVKGCGAKETKIIEAHGEPIENPDKPAVEATCTTAGKTAELICSECGKVAQKQTTIKKLGHEMDELCADETGHWYACTRCGETEKAKAHDFGKALCEDEAQCKVCGWDKTPGEHLWGKAKVTKKATCIEDGEETYTCTVKGCGEKKTVAVEAHGEPIENPDKPAVEATCTTAGKTAELICSECGKVAQKQTTIKKLGHEMDELCADEVNHWYACTRCDATEKAKAHDFGKALCEDEAECKVCGWEKTPGEHTWGKAKVTKKATCIEDGEETYTCTVKGCGAKKTEVIEAHGEAVENPKKPAVEATCTTAGKTAELICSECSKMVQKQTTIKKLGHEYSDWTALNAEEHQRVCANDGEHIEIGAHKFDKNDVCNTCGYEKEISAGSIWFSDPDVGYLMMLWEWVPAEEVDGFDYYQVLYYNDDSNRWENWLGSDINNNMVMVNDPGCQPGTYTKVRLIAIDEERNDDGYWEIVDEKIIYEEDINLIIGVASGAPTVTINKESGSNYSILIDNLLGQNDSSYEFMTCNEANGNGERWGQTMPTEGMGMIQLNLDWPHFETGYYRVREFVNMEGGMDTASFDIRDSGWIRCIDCGHTATNDHPVSNIRLEGSRIVWDEPAVKNNDYGYSVKVSQNGGRTWTEESFYGGNQTESHFMHFAPGHYDTIEIKTFLPEGCCDHEVGCVTAPIDLTVIEKQAAANASVVFVPMGNDTYSIEIDGFTPGNWADFALAMGADGRDRYGSWGTGEADSTGCVVRDDIRFFWNSPITMEELLTNGYYDLYEFDLQFANNGKSVTMTRISHGGWTKSVIAGGGGGSGSSVKSATVFIRHMMEEVGDVENALEVVDGHVQITVPGYGTARAGEKLPVPEMGSGWTYNGWSVVIVGENGAKNYQGKFDEITPELEAELLAAIDNDYRIFMDATSYAEGIGHNGFDLTYDLSSNDVVYTLSVPAGADDEYFVSLINFDHADSYFTSVMKDDNYSGTMWALIEQYGHYGTGVEVINTNGQTVASFRTEGVGVEPGSGKMSDTTPVITINYAQSNSNTIVYEISNISAQKDYNFELVSPDANGESSSVYMLGKLDQDGKLTLYTGTDHPLNTSVKMYGVYAETLGNGDHRMMITKPVTVSVPVYSN